MKIFLFCLSFVAVQLSLSQGVSVKNNYKAHFAASLIRFPQGVKTALSQTKNNRPELEKALIYFYNTADSLKIKSINFLIANMPLHSSQNYYWSDNKGNKIRFNEAEYASFNEAVNAINQLRVKYKDIHPVPYTYQDIDSITGDQLIETVNQAVNQWMKKYNAPPKEKQQTIFFEYLLPYRVSVEPLQTWRPTYSNTFKNLLAVGNSAEGQYSALKQVIKDKFQNLWSTEYKTEPLPRLGALQILSRGKGYCEDMADMAVFIARSSGVPATVDNIPAWATASGNHFLNYLPLDSNHIHFDSNQDSLGREPGKVLRSTYSAQKDAIATLLDTTEIPSGFMRIKTYKDVTSEYWPVANFEVPLSLPIIKSKKAVFVAVWNSASWQPIWYGLIRGNTASFKNMGKGVVYVPFYFEDKKLVPAGWPFALGYNNKAILKPDSLHLQTVVLPQQEKFLKYRPGKRYRLYYWNNRWQLLEEKIAPEQCTQLSFNKVPKNALFLLVPDYTQGKERPFIITEKGERIWW